MLVPTPTFPLDSKMADGTKLVAESNFARKFGDAAPTVALVCTELVAAFGCDVGPLAVAPIVVAVLPVCGLASANADAGIPPSVSASAAFNAYGTLTSSTRGDC